MTARTGSEEPRLLANDTHNPSTSERVFTFDIASCGFIPSFIASTIWRNFRVPHCHFSFFDRSHGEYKDIYKGVLAICKPPKQLALLRERKRERDSSFPSIKRMESSQVINVLAKVFRPQTNSNFSFCFRKNFLNHKPQNFPSAANPLPT